MGQHLVTHDPCDPSDFRDPFDPWSMTHRPIPCSEMGTSSPPPKRVEHPNFGPHLLWPNGCMDQDVTWYGGRPRPTQAHTRHSVRCRPSYPREKRAHPPHPSFGPCLLWPNGWMDEDAAWYGNRPPRPRPHCIRWGSQLSRKGHSSPPFSAHVYYGHSRPSQLLLSSC